MIHPAARAIVGKTLPELQDLFEQLMMGTLDHHTMGDMSPYGFHWAIMDEVARQRREAEQRLETP